MKSKVAVFAANLVALLVAPSTAAAGDTRCVGFLPPGAYDNVVVPPGAFCLMEAAEVRGNIKNFGQLSAIDTVVGGNVEGEPGPATSTLLGAGARGEAVTVRGNVQIKGQTGTSGYSGAGGRVVRIGGDFSYLENSGPLVANTGIIGGNVKAEQNTGGGFIVSSRIGGNLECKENTPPLLVEFNTIGGNDKCPE